MPKDEVETLEEATALIEEAWQKFCGGHISFGQMPSVQVGNVVVRHCTLRGGIYASGSSNFVIGDLDGNWIANCQDADHIRQHINQKKAYWERISI